MVDARKKNRRELESAWMGRVCALGRAVRAGCPIMLFAINVSQNFVVHITL